MNAFLHNLAAHLCIEPLQRTPYNVDVPQIWVCRRLCVPRAAALERRVFKSLFHIAANWDGRMHDAACKQFVTGGLRSVRNRVSLSRITHFIDQSCTVAATKN